MADEKKLKALAAAMAKIEKDFGKGAIMKLGDEKIENVDVIPSGSLGLDIALGVGGYPRGRIIEIYGPESSAFIDAEHAFDRFYAANLGVDVDNLFISQPDNGEQALQIADQLISSAAVDIIVIDSVAALTPKAEIEGEMGDNKVGLQARLMSQALRKMTSTIAKTNTTCIFINQLREKIGVMFGNPETTTGGNALKFYASVRIDGEDCKEQGSTSIPQVRIRHSVWQWCQQSGRNSRPVSKERHRKEDRLMVLLWSVKTGTGSRGMHQTAERQCRALRRIRSKDKGNARSSSNERSQRQRQRRRSARELRIKS